MQLPGQIIDGFVFQIQLLHLSVFEHLAYPRCLPLLRAFPRVHFGVYHMCVCVRVNVCAGSAEAKLWAQQQA